MFIKGNDKDQSCIRKEIVTTQHSDKESRVAEMNVTKDKREGSYQTLYR